MVLSNHDIELRSSSFMFGRTQASLVLLSLNHDLVTITDVKALARLGNALALQGVPFIMVHSFSFRFMDACGITFATDTTCINRHRDHLGLISDMDDSCDPCLSRCRFDCKGSEG